MKSRLIVPMLLALISAAGCQQEQAEQSHLPNDTTSAVEGYTLPEGVDASKYVLDVEPDGAQDVLAARESAQDSEDIVIQGRIGGEKDPWVGGRAAFSIVDPSLQACSDKPDCTCPVPWDYCCETDVPAASALITVVDDNGEVIRADARALLPVKELSTVVVQGKAKVDEEGNLVVLASGIFVKSL